MTRKHFAVVGDPIAQSLSPIIHEAAYRVLKVDWNYSSVLVPSGQLHTLVAERRYQGLSVTMPLKKEAYRLSTPSNMAAIDTQIVNTLVLGSSETLGYNTDVFGLIKTLEHLPKPGKCVVLGSGATACSAIYALLQMYPSNSVEVFARNVTALQELSTRFSDRIVTSPLSGENIDADLVINTIPDKKFRATGYLLNTGYSQVGAHDAEVISGKEMLLWQALAQIRIFFNNDPELSLPIESEVIEQMRLSLNNA